VRLVAGVGVTAGVAWACLRWKPSRVIIEGGSMAPTLAPGDWALTIPLRHPKIGNVVVVEHPGRPGYEMVTPSASERSVTTNGGSKAISPKRPPTAGSSVR